MRLLTTLLSTFVLAAVLVPAPAAAKPGQLTLFEAPTEVLSGDADLRERTLREIAALGADRLRIIVTWRSYAPVPDQRTVPPIDERDPAEYDLQRLDRAVAGARAAGLAVLLTVSGPVPRWATKHRRDHVTYPSARRFGRFVEMLGTRYRGQVDAWSIWNEPNHPDFLRPQWKRDGRGKRALSGLLYRRLFQSAERALRRSGNGGDHVLVGETAPRGTGKVVHPLRFLRRALCLDSRWRKDPGCGRLRADGYAHHAYTTRSGPWFRPPSGNDVTIGVLDRLNRVLHRAGRAGAVRKGLPIWLTEFGIQSEPDPFLGVSETAQAEFRAISERIAWRNPRVRAFSQYLMRDDRPVATASGTTYPGFESGLRGHDGDRKRAYDAFRTPLVATRGARRTTLWGLVRPAAGRTSVLIDVRARGSERWHFLKRDRTDARGAWTTTTRKVGSRRYRVRWRDRDGRLHTGPLTRSYAHR